MMIRVANRDTHLSSGQHMFCVPVVVSKPKECVTVRDKQVLGFSNFSNSVFVLNVILLLIVIN
jgi:hypothetical protein